MKYFYNLIVFFFFLTSISISQAKEPAKESAKESAKVETASPETTTESTPKVIDFEAEIIEGERKTPTLFLQIGLEKPTMDTVLYQRKDFNDFHAVTKGRRPTYQVPVKQ